MDDAIERFQRYLRVERNASDLTVKSYHEDLESLLEFCRDRQVCNSCRVPPAFDAVSPLANGIIARLLAMRFEIGQGFGQVREKRIDHTRDVTEFRPGSICNGRCN